MSHTYTNLIYHIVFSTKERRSYISIELLERLTQYVGGIIRERNGKLLAMNGPENHVHLLASLAPRLAVSEQVKDIKCLSSAWIHDIYPNHKLFAWQEGYSAFSVGKANFSQVQQYILNQQEHHRKATFEEELVAMLKRAGVEYDPRYLFD